jgi:hypothetical protein
MPITDSQSAQVTTILKRLLGALMALIGGLLVVAIGVFILGMAMISGNPGHRSFSKRFVFAFRPAH